MDSGPNQYVWFDNGCGPATKPQPIHTHSITTTNHTHLHLQDTQSHALAEEVEHGDGEPLEGLLSGLEHHGALRHGAGLGEVLHGVRLEVPGLLCAFVGRGGFGRSVGRSMLDNVHSGSSEFIETHTRTHLMTSSRGRFVASTPTCPVSRCVGIGIGVESRKEGLIDQTRRRAATPPNPFER